MRLPEFSGLGICSLLICAFAKIAQDKWANVSDLLRSLRTNERLWGNCLDRSWQMSLMTNEWMWAIRSGHSGQMSELIGFLSKSITFIFRSQKISDWLKKKKFYRIFCTFFTVFFKKQKICSFLLSEVSESLRLLRTNERPQAICSGRSEGMSDREQIAQVTDQKWVNERIAHFLNKSLICSLCFGKKRAIHSEIRWANFQPC